MNWSVSKYSTISHCQLFEPFLRETKAKYQLTQIADHNVGLSRRSMISKIQWSFWIFLVELWGLLARIRKYQDLLEHSRHLETDCGWSNLQATHFGFSSTKFNHRFFYWNWLRFPKLSSWTCHLRDGSNSFYPFRVFGRSDCRPFWTDFPARESQEFGRRSFWLCLIWTPQEFFWL